MYNPSINLNTHEVPKSVLEEVQRYEKLLTVTPEKLKAITKHFVSELEKGLSVKGGNIPMIPTWVMDYPDGSETGEFIAIDLGGTNLRIVAVSLLGGGKFETKQDKYALPDGLRTTQHRDELFNFITVSLEKFIEKEFPSGIPKGTVLPLGFTFSYPSSQTRIDTGVLQRWTKGFDIPNVEGVDVVPLLMEKINAKGLPIKLVALINDTAGALVASRYTHPKTELGLIFGTGVNGAYYDRVSNIPKLQGKLKDDIPQDSPMLINCEYGSFDNEHLVLPRTHIDIQIDEESPRPGQQAFEKMSSGLYLGEIIRLILLDFHSKKLLFQGVSKDSKAWELFNTPYILDTSFLAHIEMDESADLEDISRLFKEQLHVETCLEERKVAHALSILIGTRSARLSICGIAAVCTKMGYTNCNCAADGSVYEKYPKFSERARDGLNDIFGWSDKGIAPEEYPLTINHAEDGSGVGAAIIAALTAKRIEKGLSVGLADA